jgi:hypothetical protein
MFHSSAVAAPFRVRSSPDTTADTRVAQCRLKPAATENRLYGTALVVIGSVGAPIWNPFDDVLAVVHLFAFTAD